MYNRVDLDRRTSEPREDIRLTPAAVSRSALVHEFHGTSDGYVHSPLRSSNCLSMSPVVNRKRYDLFLLPDTVCDSTVVWSDNPHTS